MTTNVPKRTVRSTSWGATDVGRKRERNEDSFFVDDDLQLYIVADGMGGHLGGGMASRMAVATISTLVRKLIDDPDGTLEDAGVPLQNQDPRSVLRYAIQAASKEIYARSIKDPGLRGMGTTVVVLWFCGGKVYLANVGDSRGYLVRSDQLKQITTDHSLVGEQMRAGLLTEKDAKASKMKNVITRSVGFQASVEVDIEMRMPQDGDVYLLCSDGLTNLVPDPALHETIKSSPVAETCRGLVALANRNGGDDNITAVLVRAQLGAAGGIDPDATEEWEENTEQLS